MDGQPMFLLACRQRLRWNAGAAANTAANDVKMPLRSILLLRDFASYLLPAFASQSRAQASRQCSSSTPSTNGAMSVLRQFKRLAWIVGFALAAAQAAAQERTIRTGPCGWWSGSPPAAPPTSWRGFLPIGCAARLGRS